MTVPFFEDGQVRLFDSTTIARHIDRNGSGTKLFPDGSEREMAHWVELADRACEAGRVFANGRLMADPQARSEVLPSMIPDAMRPTLNEMALLGGAYLQTKYDLGGSESDARAQLRASLNPLVSAIADGKKHLIGDALTFADIATATALAFVRPVADLYISLGPATRRCFTLSDLSSEYASAIAWRDDLYARWRK